MSDPVVSNDVNQKFLEVFDEGLKVTLPNAFQAVSDFKTSWSSSPDGVPNVLIKKCICTISVPMFLLFDSSLNESTFPEW